MPEPQENRNFGWISIVEEGILACATPNQKSYMIEPVIMVYTKTNI
jgi:hypothetical protein